MSLAAPYQEHYYIADGTTTTFAFGEDFTALVAANVKCIVYFEDGTSSVPVFTVNTETGYITISALTKPDGTILTAPPLGSVVRLFRETPEQQNVSASQLQNYTAKQLERIFDAIVAMMQETSYSEQHKSLRLTEPQRDISLSKLSDEEDKTILYWDAEEGKIKTTGYTQEELINQVNAANNTANEAKTQAINTKNALTAHVSNTSNPHQTSFENLKDANIVDPEHGEFLMFDGLHWKNVMSSGTVGWGGILGDIHDQTDLFNTFVQKSGDTMTGTLVHAYGSGSKYNTNLSTSYFNVYVNQTEFRIEHKYGSYNGNLVFRAYTGDVTLYPNNDNRAIFGLPTRRWNKVYTTHLVADSTGAKVLIVPDDKNDTLAVLGDIAFKSTDVAITSAASGQYLQYDGSKWVNATFSGANTDLSNLTTTGKANVSAQGTYDAGATYEAGTVGAAIKDKADTDLANVLVNIDFVIESQLPTAENNYTWYRKYRSGWVEQGGSADFSATSGTVYTVTLLVTMADANYTAIGIPSMIGSGTGGFSIGVDSRTTTQVSFRGSTSSTNIVNVWNWEVKGMAAS